VIFGAALGNPWAASFDLPRQLLFPIQPTPPLAATGGARTDLTLRVYHLPDSRRAESYEFASWFRFGEHHALRPLLSYAGIESSELAQFGTGPASLQWTWDLRGFGRPGLALDLLGVAPAGDPDLHPLSARAPSLHLRVRYSVWASDRGATWVGWATRRVSPPESRNQPLASFPSASGFEAGWSTVPGPWMVAVSARTEFAGVPDHTWAEAMLSRRLERTLALVSGVTVDIGPRASRLADLGWMVGIQWIPAPPAESP
jgi:hypothetical protein